MNKKQGFAVVSTLLIALGSLTACGNNNANNPGASQGTSNNANASQSTSASNDSGQAGGKIQIDEFNSFETFDPAIAYSLLDNEVVFQLYSQLVTYKPGSSDITGDIATDWKVSPDGLTYTFHLRKDAKFSNGDAVTAQSFIDEFERVLDKSVGSPGESFIDPIIVGSAAYHNGTAKTISGMTAPDPYTLVIHLTKPEPFFLKVLAQEFFSAVDKKYIDSIGNKAFAFEPMGSGPFEMKSYSPGQELVLVKNPKYYEPGTPKLDEVDFNIETNEQASALLFKQGTTAFISFNQNIDSQDFVSMINDPKWKNDFSKEALNTLAFLNINNKLGPLQNKLVRQAVEYAIDKSKLVKLQNGRATPANQILPPNIPGYETNLPASSTYNFDPQKAKDLLAQAGYSNGFNTEILTPNDPSTVKLVQSIQADLLAVGIHASIKPVTISAYGSLARSGKEGLIMEIWSQDYPDPSDFLDTLLNSVNIPAINHSYYSNPTVDSELNKAANMPDGSARIGLYQDVQNQALADAGIVPLYYPVQYALVQPWVKGFYINPVRLDPLQDISVVPH